MSNRLALILGLLILTALIADQLLNGGEATLFLARRFLVFVEWMTFWR